MTVNPQTLFFGGILNGADPWLNQPIYLWLGILWWVVVIPVTWFVLKRIWWDPYWKFHGLHYAKKNDSAACLISDDMGDTMMVAEHIAKCIFSYGEDDYEIEIPEMPLHIIKIGGIVIDVIGLMLVLTGNLWGILLFPVGAFGYFIERLVPWFYQKIFWYPTKYLPDLTWQKAALYKFGKVNFDCKIAQLLQNGEWEQYPVVNCGGIAVEWITDLNHWCERRTRQHKAIVRSARDWNRQHENDQVHTYAKYQKYLNNGNIIAPEEIKASYVVPWVRIDLGFPFNLKNVDWAGKLRQMAKTREKKGDQEQNRWVWILIGGGVGLFIFIILIRVAIKVFFPGK